MVRSYRVHRGAEAPANTDYRLVVAVVSLAFVHRARPKKSPKFNVLRLTTDAKVCAAYNDSLQARLPQVAASTNGVEEKWAQVSAVIHASAADTIGYARPRRRPWISDATLEAVDQKAAARLAKDTAEWRRLCGVVRAKTKADRKRYFNQLADEAEEGLNNNQLKGAYRAIKQISGRASASQQCPINKADGQPCASKEETLARWQEHYETMLNHPPATACPDLDREASSASEAPEVCSDPPSLQEVQEAN